MTYWQRKQLRYSVAMHYRKTFHGSLSPALQIIAAFYADHNPGRRAACLTLSRIRRDVIFRPCLHANLQSCRGMDAAHTGHQYWHINIQAPPIGTGYPSCQWKVSAMLAKLSLSMVILQASTLRIFIRIRLRLDAMGANVTQQMHGYRAPDCRDVWGKSRFHSGMMAR